MTRFLVPILTFAFPAAAAAQVSAPDDFKEVVALFLVLIDLLVVIVFALTLIIFLWAVTKTWIIGGGDAAEVEKGKKVVVASVIALVFMSGLWGIVALVRSALV